MDTVAELDTVLAEVRAMREEALASLRSVRRELADLRRAMGRDELVPWEQVAREWGRVSARSARIAWAKLATRDATIRRHPRGAYRSDLERVMAGETTAPAAARRRLIAATNQLLDGRA